MGRIFDRLYTFSQQHVPGCLLILFGLVGPSLSAGTSISSALVVLLEKANRQELMSDSAGIYLRELVQEAGRLQGYAYEAEAHYLLGKRSFLLMEDSIAAFHFQKAGKLFLQEKNWEKTGFSNFQLGLIHLQAHRLDSALLSFQTAIDIYQDHDLKKNLWSPYMGISSLYTIEGNIPAAFKYGQLSVDALQYADDNTSRKIALNHMLNLARENDSIEVYATYSPLLLEMYSPLEMEDHIIQHIHHFVSIADPQQRVEALQRAIKRLSLWTPTLELVSTYLFLGQTFVELNEIPSAIQALESGYHLERDSLHMVHFTPLFLRSLSRLYEQQEQFPIALKYYVAYSEINDSLQQVYNTAKTEELQLQYETRTKDAEIAQQRSMLDRRTLQRNMIVLLALAFLGSGIFIYYNQRRYFKDQATIARQQEVLHQKEISELKKQHEITNLQTLVTTQEKERNRIALDLHDSLGSLLASLKIQFRKFISTVDQEKLQEVSVEHMQLIDTISVETRRIAHNMMPPALVRMGLTAALEDLAGILDQDYQLKVSFQDIDYDHALSREKEITLYRIVQELCANVIHHAGARHLLIQLSRHNGSATLVVEDDGKGFVPGENPSEGLGIESITSRVAFMEGEMELWSAPGEGTSVTIHIPVT